MTDAKADSATVPPAATLSQDTATAPPPQAGKTLPKVTPPTSIDIDSKPSDFDGQLATNDEIPSDATLAKVADYVLLDKYGKTHTFQSLYNSPNGPRRVLVVFVRHFFCGNCQEYIRTLAESISNDALLGLPVSTSVVIIGCGNPQLIDMYVEATRCPFPLYTDPKSVLFDALGMVKTLALGEKPAYMKMGFLKGVFTGMGQALKQLPKGLTLQSGDQRQVGGEFLFEPLDLVTPITTPTDAQGGAAIMEACDPRPMQSGAGGQLEVKKITWCHRMRSTRDHAEIPEIMELLGLDGHGKPIKDTALWEKTIRARKGTGLSMASKLNELAAAQNAEAGKA
ncbi:fmHP [Cordyceps fumosorosea ARSEF 2679]|uniref:FmHP n=1 Tax=Cordyceps fumosorosea (strain ARSEF 2679) TaxID=1081104 RepID=A0A162MKB3_CORFA|nr:fmHP [Cordyceps fumosorosea ARSEF 2679]OAA63210.1 fmHP [Cordyceps fumosorosea ARSEF 2679]